ncbi:hypothetical protein N7497_003746 [Penicillium chrysogenum]|nr:hypothetical protein N7497_003746 [Penicillium chrysogenum]
MTHEIRYCIQSNEDFVDYLLLEDKAIYMNFFDWMFKTSREKVLQSYDEYWRRLCQYFELFARRRVNDDVHKQMRRFLNGVFPAERKIARRTKEKNTLDVDVFCVIYRRHWVHSRFFAWKYDRTIFHGHALVRHYGTRPGFLLPQKTSLPDDSSMSKRKRTDAFQSVLPKYVSLEDLPDSVCYRDIELFYLKTLKANVTSFVPSSSFTISKVDQKALMELTPELIWRLRVPHRSLSLPLRWKPEVLNMPLLRRLERTPCDYELHESLPMTYESSRQALRELGRMLDFKTISDITTSAAGLQTKSIEFYQPGAAKGAWPVWRRGLRKVLPNTIHRARPPACRSSSTVSGRSITHRWKHAQDKRSISTAMRTSVLSANTLRALSAPLSKTRSSQKISGQASEILGGRRSRDSQKGPFPDAFVLEVDRQIKQPLGESDVEGCDVDSLADEDLELRTPKELWLRISYLLDASKLPRTWLRFCGSLNRPDEAIESIGILMTAIMNCLDRRKSPRLPSFSIESCSAQIFFQANRFSSSPPY